MKKLFFASLFIIGASAMSFAQGFQRPTPQAQVDRLKTQITGISDDQSAKLLAIYTAASKSQDSLMATANGDFGSIREKMAPMRAAQSAKVKAVLTADQQKAFDALPQRGPGGGAPRN